MSAAERARHDAAAVIMLAHEVQAAAKTGGPAAVNDAATRLQRALGHLVDGPRRERLTFVAALAHAAADFAADVPAGRRDRVFARLSMTDEQLFASAVLTLINDPTGGQREW